MTGSPSQLQTSVSLTSVDNVNAIAASGKAPANGGIDASSYAFAANLLGTSATYAGSTFTLGSAAGPSPVTSKTITLPTGRGNHCPPGHSDGRDSGGSWVRGRLHVRTQQGQDGEELQHEHVTYCTDVDYGDGLPTQATRPAVESPQITKS